MKHDPELAGFLSKMSRERERQRKEQEMQMEMDLHRLRVQMAMIPIWMSIGMLEAATPKP